jgi:hypothetical protein
MYSLWYNVNRGFLELSSARHLKALSDRGEKTNNIFQFSAKHAVGVTYFISSDKK